MLSLISETTAPISSTYRYNSMQDSAHPKEAHPCDEHTSALALESPRMAYKDAPFEEVNPKIFANSISLAPNIQSLTILPLSDRQMSWLSPLIEQFQRKYPPKLTSITLYTPHSDSKDEKTQATIAKLHSELLLALSNHQLERIGFHDETDSQSLLSHLPFSQFFKSSPNIRQIAVLTRETPLPLNIPFNLCAHLSEVTLRVCHTSDDASAMHFLAPLKSCAKLTKVTLDRFWSFDTACAFFSTAHQIPLKELRFKDTSVISSDDELNAITKQLPQLTVFEQNFFYTGRNKISDEGIEQLGKNCRNLSSFAFSFERVTDRGFSAFVQHVPHLQQLETYSASQLTTHSLLALALFCPHLISVKLTLWNTLSELGLSALAECCPRLKYLVISLCQKISIEGLKTLITSAPQLKMLYFSGCTDRWTLAAVKELQKSHPTKLTLNSLEFPNQKIPIDPPETLQESPGATSFQSRLTRLLVQSALHRDRKAVAFLKSFSSEQSS